jgi:hypothetical protein
VKLLLTDRFCDRAEPQNNEAQTDYFDETVPGLALRVAMSGRKTWTLHFTSPGERKRARLTLGTYPATSLGSARTQALQTRGEVEAGRDPRSGADDETFKAICQEYLRRTTIRTKVEFWSRVAPSEWGSREVDYDGPDADGCPIEVMLNKADFRHWLDKLDVPAKPKPSRTSPRYNLARRAFDALGPLDNLPNPDLIKCVGDWLKAERLPPPSRTTILRAFGRRSG